MKQTISILLASLALAVSGYLGWRMWQPNLTGHWDINEVSVNESYSAHNWIKTLDITNDNIVHLNYDPDNPNPAIGSVSRLFRNMDIGPSCLSLNIDYHPDGNTLHLVLPNYEKPSEPYHLTAVRNFKCPHPWKPEH